MKKLRIIAVFVTLISLFFSCQANTYDEISPLVSNPTYSKDVGIIVQTNCVGCHAANAQYPTLETYTQLKDACQNGDVLCRIQGACGAVMPMTGAMPQNKVSTILNWAQSGYPN
jgi:uncharacterized membrane protein